MEANNSLKLDYNKHFPASHTLRICKSYSINGYIFSEVFKMKFVIISGKT